MSGKQKYAIDEFFSGKMTEYSMILASLSWRQTSIFSLMLARQRCSELNPGCANQLVPDRPMVRIQRTQAKIIRQYRLIFIAIDFKGSDPG